MSLGQSERENGGEIVRELGATKQEGSSECECSVENKLRSK